MYRSVPLPGAVQRDTQRLAQSLGGLRRPLRVLDAALLERDQGYLVDMRFSVADLNATSMLAWAGPARLDLGPYPAVAAWLARCLARPGRRAARWPACLNDWLPVTKNG